MAFGVGVLSIQGDFEKHMIAVKEASASAEPIEVRTPADLGRVDRLIIPGGESTTVGLLLRLFGLGEAIKSKVQEGMPVWGTCMGFIMLAADVEGRKDQYTLGVLDVTIRRNAFGAQVHSFEDSVKVKGFESETLAVFIRAPEAVRLGSGVEELARYDNRIVAVRQGNVIGTSFHPELTNDRRFHEWFLTL